MCPFLDFMSSFSQQLKYSPLIKRVGSLEPDCLGSWILTLLLLSVYLSASCLHSLPRSYMQWHSKIRAASVYKQDSAGVEMPLGNRHSMRGTKRPGKVRPRHWICFISVWSPLFHETLHLWLNKSGIYGSLEHKQDLCQKTSNPFWLCHRCRKWGGCASLTVTARL